MLQRILFPQTAWLLLLLIPGIIIGFYPGYFSKAFGSIQWMVHAHMFFMLLWAALSISQPFLILKKQYRLHKTIGKLSYWIMPLVFVSGYGVLQTGYDNRREQIALAVAEGKLLIPESRIPIMAAERMGLSMVYYFLLIVLYLLAIGYKKKVQYHATFMLGAIFTMLGPTFGRVINVFHQQLGTTPGLLSNIGIELFIILFFIALAFYQKRKGYTMKPALVVSGIYFFSILTVFILAQTSIWQKFVELFLMR